MNTEIASFQLLQNALKAAQLRQQVYSNNIANMDTPGFKRSDVQFESMLQSELQRMQTTSSPSGADWTGLLNVQPVVIQDSTTTVDNNGNNVDVDAEMAKLAENQIQYNALIEDVKTRLDRLRSAIDGGSM